MADITRLGMHDVLFFPLVYYGRNEKFKGLRLDVKLFGGLEQQLFIAIEPVSPTLLYVPEEIREEVAGIVRCLGYKCKIFYPLSLL